MTQANEALARRWFEEVWNKGRADAVDEMFAENGIAHGLSDDAGSPLRGPAAFKEFHGKFVEAFPDIVVTVEDTIAEGDKIAARCTVRGKHQGDSLGFAATQAPIEITGIAIVRIENGKIVEAWNNFDFMTMYKQLGAI
ncbi:MAG: putative ester cyclase [Acidobacteria bacterium]|nr:putative ester cyclase [Acidobacteriota bacterium]